MDSPSIRALLGQALPFAPTPSQERLLEALADFLAQPRPEQVFLLKGYAGTGKTSSLKALVSILPALGRRPVLLAPTGRAAKVLSDLSGQPASTVHRKIYRQETGAYGARFQLDRNLHKRALFIVDEASMVSNESNENAAFGSGRLLEDLLEFVQAGEDCQLMFIGDIAQLPPVGTRVSPALNKVALRRMGLEPLEVELTDVVRQAQDSGILHNATMLREALPAFKDEPKIPRFRWEGFDDVARVNGSELVELVNESFDQVGIDQTVLITRSNKRALLFNQGIRNAVLYRDDEISGGDQVMVVKNNYFWLRDNPKAPFIANGDTAEILHLGRHSERHGLNFRDATLRLKSLDLELDAKILLDALHSESPGLGEQQQRALYESVSQEYAHVGNARERQKLIREDPFFNALQLKFSYAITCHKAQGGQWRRVFIDQGYFVDDMLDLEYLRWLYTALTRATEKLYWVNFQPSFFED